jgi:hypothetical protein
MEDGEARRQLTLLEPPKEKPLNWLTEDAELQTVRTSLVAIKQQATAPDAFDLAKEVLEQSMSVFARMEVDVDIIDFRFEDETMGAMVDVSFDMPHNTRLRLRHVFRRDGELQAHFVMTMEVGAPDRCFDAFTSMKPADLPTNA